MAEKEGRCVNCGSLLFLDPYQPKGHCLFCDCVFDTQEAFEAHAEPERFTFPNEKQPQYEGPALGPERTKRRRVEAVAPAPVAAPEAGEERYLLPEKKVPSLKIPTRVVILYLALTLVFLGIISAIAFPLVAKRDHRLNEVTARLADRLSYPLDRTRDIRVQEMGANRVTLVLAQDISPEESVEIFNLYCDVRAEVVELKDDSFRHKKKPVTVFIATPAGGYLIDRPADEAALQPQAILPLG